MVYNITSLILLGRKPNATCVSGKINSVQNKWERVSKTTDETTVLRGSHRRGPEVSQASYPSVKTIPP